LIIKSHLKIIFWPTSSLDQNLNPQNTSCIPPVKILIRLEFEPKSLFLDGF